MPGHFSTAAALQFSVSDSDDSDEDEDEEEEEDGQKESSGKAASTSGTTQGQSQQQQAPAVMAAVQDNSSTNSSSSSSSSSGSSNRDAADSNTGSKEVPSTSGRGLLDLVLPAGTGSSTGSGGASSSSEWAAGLRLWQLWTAKPFYPLVPDAQASDWSNKTQHTHASLPLSQPTFYTAPDIALPLLTIMMQSVQLPWKQGPSHSWLV
jgi:hypothetical protein